ncbi:hypothetical protein IPG36_01560 [bacterium]|nr:MAG: hypothetical protein IPG36_01560 [bacterium]
MVPIENIGLLEPLSATTVMYVSYRTYLPPSTFSVVSANTRTRYVPAWRGVENINWRSYYTRLPSGRTAAGPVAEKSDAIEQSSNPSGERAINILEWPVVPTVIVFADTMSCLTPFWVAPVSRFCDAGVSLAAFIDDVGFMVGVIEPAVLEGTSVWAGVETPACRKGLAPTVAKVIPAKLRQASILPINTTRCLF